MSEVVRFPVLMEENRVTNIFRGTSFAGQPPYPAFKLWRKLQRMVRRDMPKVLIVSSSLLQIIIS